MPRVHALGSPPLRERGLKSINDIVTSLSSRVAPSQGAWIEMFNYWREALLEYVAPSQGAWIEITFTAALFPGARVAPSQGAWIEIKICNNIIDLVFVSLPLRERGLKFRYCQHIRFCFCVAPSQGAWIEIADI